MVTPTRTGNVFCTICRSPVHMGTHRKPPLPSNESASLVFAVYMSPSLLFGGEGGGSVHV